MRLYTKIAELFALEMIISVFSTIIIQSIAILNTEFWSFVAVLAVFILTWILFFAGCRRTLFFSYMLSNQKGEEKYLKMSVIPLALMTAAAVIISCFDSEPAYTYMFLPFKLFSVLGLFKPLSALLCGILFALPILAVYLMRPEGDDPDDDN